MVINVVSIMREDGLRFECFEDVKRWIDLRLLELLEA